jgi:nicotinic acid mononucleotide adenylyltransferase
MFNTVGKLIKELSKYKSNTKIEVSSNSLQKNKNLYTVETINEIAQKKDVNNKKLIALVFFTK